MSFSRPDKLTHSRTMLYEIDLLRHTAQRLDEDKWQTDFDKWGCLESFLLHFRNLIEFFGHDDPRDDTLSIRKPEAFWRDKSKMPEKAVLDQLYRPDLWKKYEATPEKISKYLQHCTQKRVDPKVWPVREMYAELKDLVDKFEQLLPDRSRTWKAPVLTIKAVLLGPESAGTATVIKGKSF